MSFSIPYQVPNKYAQRQQSTHAFDTPCNDRMRCFAWIFVCDLCATANGHRQHSPASSHSSSELLCFSFFHLTGNYSFFCGHWKHLIAKWNNVWQPDSGTVLSFLTIEFIQCGNSVRWSCVLVAHRDTKDFLINFSEPYDTRWQDSHSTCTIFEMWSHHNERPTTTAKTFHSLFSGNCWKPSAGKSTPFDAKNKLHFMHRLYAH